jgi:hypothetical protein
MSEKHIGNKESGSELTKSPEHSASDHERLEKAKHEALKAAAEHEKVNVDEILEKAKSEAKATVESAPASTDEDQKTANTYWFSKQYRNDSYKQMISGVQSRLSKGDRAVSKLIHQPIVEKVSEIGSRTVARPSGLLFGSICSFVASMITYIVARRNGYNMTYSVFILSFLGGFLIGIVAEYGYKLVRSVASRP